jgi:hypothetical protein
MLWANFQRLPKVVHPLMGGLGTIVPGQLQPNILPFFITIGQPWVCVLVRECSSWSCVCSDDAELLKLLGFY